MSSFFDELPDIPEKGGIFSDEYSKDTRKEKLNLSIGMIFDDDGKRKELKFIKEVETEIFEKNLDKEYSTLLGLPDYNKAVFKHFFPNNDLVEGGNFFCTQSATGGSALRVGSEILRKFLNETIYVSNLTFSFYSYLFNECNIKSYPYYDKDTKTLDFKNLQTFLHHLPDNSVINLQLCNHNPTGLDLNEQQWDTLAKLFQEKKHFAFFDCAYLGLASGSFEKDLYGLHCFLNHKVEFFLAYSSAKSSLNYSDDVGALIGWIKDPKIVENILSNIACINRGYFSFSSLQGARIIQNILSTRRIDLEKEISSIVSDLNEKRKTIVSLLTAQNADSELINLIRHQKGIYLFLDLNNEQVEIFKKKFGIYVCDYGRVNLTGLNKSNIEYFTENLVKLIK